MQLLKSQVVEVLKENPDTRNSDIALTIAIWQKFYPNKIHSYEFGDCVLLSDLYELPREDNIKRIRAKLAELAIGRILSDEVKGDEHYYLPTSSKVAMQRQINQGDWEKALGYFRRTARTQIDELPQPVGNEFTIQIINMGSLGKRFLVYGDGNDRMEVNINMQGEWSCSCDEPDCVHIRAVKDMVRQAIKKNQNEKSS